jgi:hypothetical protein
MRFIIQTDKLCQTKNVLVPTIAQDQKAVRQNHGDWGNWDR